MLLKWILLIAWSANGTAYTTQEFDTREACVKAAEWVQVNNSRGGAQEKAEAALGLQPGQEMPAEWFGA